MRRAGVVLTTAMTISFSLATAVGVGAPSAVAVEQTTCPAVAIVAAQGSEQPKTVVPTVYAEDSPYTSSGYEAENLRPLLQYAEQRHVELTGESLLRDVPILALEPDVYPADLPLPAIAESDETISVEESVIRLGAILRDTPPHQIAERALKDVEKSIRSGTANTLPYLQSWEKETGCQPDYILLGYSQGAIVLTAQEPALADQGRLVGSLYLGNPILRPGMSQVVGNPEHGRGMLTYVPARLLPAMLQPKASTSTPRVDYCLRGDASCDLDIEAATDFVTAGGGVHDDYFRTPEKTDDDAQVADILAGWITGYNRGA